MTFITVRFWIAKQIFKFLGVDDLPNLFYRVQALEKVNEDLKAKLEAKEIIATIAAVPEKPTIQRPFRVNPVPHRSLRAKLERESDPEYQRQQQIKRDEAAKQPKEQVHAR